jgi:class 3 adenylate cyclase
MTGVDVRDGQEGYSVTERPRGTVTFLFTDIEGSTQLWQHYPNTMPDALAQHHAILREQMGVSMSPVEREAYERILDGARVALGDQVFAEAWAEGRATPQEQAVEYALRET